MRSTAGTMTRPLMIPTPMSLSGDKTKFHIINHIATRRRRIVVSYRQPGRAAQTRSLCNSLILKEKRVLARRLPFLHSRCPLDARPR